MKFEATSKDVAQAIADVLPTIPHRTTLPILDMVLLEVKNRKLTISSNDLDNYTASTIQVDANQDARICLPAKVLNWILSGCPDPKICFRLNTKKQVAIITHGGSTIYRIQGLPAEDYPLCDELGDQGTRIVTTERTLKQALRSARYAISQEDTNDTVSSLHLEINPGLTRLIGTDRRRLALANIAFPSRGPAFAGNLHNRSIVLALRLLRDHDSEVRLTAVGNKVEIVTASRRLHSRLIQGDYPDYQQVLHAAFSNLEECEIIVDTQSLKATLKRAYLLLGEKRVYMKLKIGRGKITLLAQTVDSHTFAQSIKCKVDGCATIKEIWFNACHTLAALGVIQDSNCLLIISNPASPMIVRPNGGPERSLHLIMPGHPPDQ